MNDAAGERGERPEVEDPPRAPAGGSAESLTAFPPSRSNSLGRPNGIEPDSVAFGAGPVRREYRGSRWPRQAEIRWAVVVVVVLALVGVAAGALWIGVV